MTALHLAIFGGQPTFSDTLHVGRPNIGDLQQFHKRLNEVLQRRWLTNSGVEVSQLEGRIAIALGVKHCICLCNGTVGLEIAVRALGMQGEVIVPSFTFIATAHALQWQGVTPVFCDIASDNPHIDPAQIERLITPRTTGIIGVHTWGRACDVATLADIAKRHKLRLLFDAAHAFGCSRRGRMIGGFGDAEVFSFHATKIFTTGEGGAVVTNNDELAAKIRLMQNFGFRGMDDVIYIGTNGKMSELAAALGLTNLESLTEFIAANQCNYGSYQKGLAGVPGIRLFVCDEAERNNYHYIVLDIDEGIAGLSRDRLMEILHAENVLVRRYFYPGCHRMEPYRTLYPDAGKHLPNTEKLSERVLCLPTGSAIGEKEIELICGIIRCVVSNAVEINRRMDSRGGNVTANRR